MTYPRWLSDEDYRVELDDEDYLQALLRGDPNPVAPQRATMVGSVLEGLGEFGANMGKMLSRIPNPMAPQTWTREGRQRNIEAWDEELDEQRAFYGQPQGLGQAAYMVGRALPYIAGGGLTSIGLRALAPGAARAAIAGESLPKGASAAARLVHYLSRPMGKTLAQLPGDLVRSQLQSLPTMALEDIGQRPEESIAGVGGEWLDSPALRALSKTAAGRIGADVVAGALIETPFRGGARGFRALRGLGRGAAGAAPPVTPPSGAGELLDMPADDRVRAIERRIMEQTGQLPPGVAETAPPRVPVVPEDLGAAPQVTPPRGPSEDDIRVLIREGFDANDLEQMSPEEMIQMAAMAREGTGTGTTLSSGPGMGQRPRGRGRQRLRPEPEPSVEHLETMGGLPDVSQLESMGARGARGLHLPRGTTGSAAAESMAVGPLQAARAEQVRINAQLEAATPRTPEYMDLTRRYWQLEDQINDLERLVGRGADEPVRIDDGGVDPDARVTDFMAGTPSPKAKPEPAGGATPEMRRYYDRKTKVRIWADSPDYYQPGQGMGEGGQFFTNFHVPDVRNPNREIYGFAHFGVSDRGEIADLSIRATFLREKGGEWIQLDDKTAKQVLGARNLVRLGRSYKTFVAQDLGVPRQSLKSTEGVRVSGARTDAEETYWAAVDAGERPRDIEFERQLHRQGREVAKIDISTWSGPGAGRAASDIRAEMSPRDAPRFDRLTRLSRNIVERVQGEISAGRARNEEEALRNLESIVPRVWHDAYETQDNLTLLRQALADARVNEGFPPAERAAAAATPTDDLGLPEGWMGTDTMGNPPSPDSPVARLQAENLRQANEWAASHEPIPLAEPEVAGRNEWWRGRDTQYPIPAHLRPIINAVEQSVGQRGLSLPQVQRYLLNEYYTPYGARRSNATSVRLRNMVMQLNRAMGLSEDMGLHGRERGYAMDFFDEVHRGVRDDLDRTAPFPIEESGPGAPRAPVAEQDIGEPHDPLRDEDTLEEIADWEASRGGDEGPDTGYFDYASEPRNPAEHLRRNPFAPSDPNMSMGPGGTYRPRRPDLSGPGPFSADDLPMDRDQFEFVQRQDGYFYRNEPYRYTNKRTGQGMAIQVVEDRWKEPRIRLNPDGTTADGQGHWLKVQWETIGDADPKDVRKGYVQYHLNADGTATDLGIKTTHIAGRPINEGGGSHYVTYQQSANAAANDLGEERTNNLVRAMARWFAQNGASPEHAKETISNLFSAIAGYRVTGAKAASRERIHAKIQRGEALTPAEEKFMRKGGIANIDARRMIARMLQDDPLSGPAITALRGAGHGISNWLGGPEGMGTIAGVAYGAASPDDPNRSLGERAQRALLFGAGMSAAGYLGREALEERAIQRELRKLKLPRGARQEVLDLVNSGGLRDSYLESGPNINYGAEPTRGWRMAPPDDPNTEHIVGSAFRLGPEGEVFASRGGTHGHAYNAAVEALQQRGMTKQQAATAIIQRLRSDDEGYVTSTGRYVTRDEGYDIAEQAGQLRQPHPQEQLFAGTMKSEMASGPFVSPKRNAVQAQYLQTLKDWQATIRDRGANSLEAKQLKSRAQMLERAMSALDDAATTGASVKSHFGSALDRTRLGSGPAVGTSTRPATTKPGLAPAVTAALPYGTATSAARMLGATGEAVLGTLMSQSEDENIRSTGHGLLGLAAFSALGPGGRQAIARAAKGQAQRLGRQHELVRKTLDFLTPRIMLDDGIAQLIDQAEVLRGVYRARAEHLAQQAEALGPEADRFLTDVITGEKFSAYMPTPQEARQIATLAADVIDMFSEQRGMKEALGMLMPSTAPGRGEDYLPRYQLRHMLDEQERLIPFNRTADPNAPRQRAEHARELGMDYVGPPEGVPGPVSPERAVRERLGEIREASFAIRHGGARGGAQIASTKLLQGLRQSSGALHPHFQNRTDAVAVAHQAWLQARKTGSPHAAALGDLYRQELNDLRQWSRSFRHNTNWKKLPESAALGPLSGAVVQREVADYVIGTPVQRTVYDKLLRAWKTSKTAYNIPTHAGNFMSNIYLAHMAGVPMWRLPGALVDAAGEIRRYGPDVQYLMEQGVLNRNILTSEASGASIDIHATAADRMEQELRHLMRTTRPATERVLREYGFEPAPVHSKARQQLHRVHKAVTDLYSNEDNWFRVAVYKQKIHEGWTQEQAANYAKWSLVNYDTKSPALAMARRWMFPFVLFPAKALPMVLTQAADHPVRFLTAAALFAGGSELLQRQFPEVTASDVPEDIRKPTFGYLLPQMVPVGVGQRGERYFTDISRLTPFSALTTNAPPGTVLGQTFPNLPLAAAQPSGPLMDVASLALNRDPYSGRQILRPGERLSPGMTARRTAEYLAQRAAPPMAGFHAPRIYGDIREGRTSDLGVDALGLVGARPRIIPKGTAQRRAQSRYNEAVRDIETQYRHDIQRARNSESARAEVRARYKERKRAALERFRHELRP